MQNSLPGGSHYLFQGFRLIRTPGLRTFVLIPLLVNLLLFSGAFYWLYLQMDGWIQQVLGMVPEFFSWLSYVIWPLAVLTILAVFTYIFSSVANWIAAPFNGLLAERVEQHLTGETLPDTSLADIMKDIPRVMTREWLKLKYYLPKAIGLLILFLIPAIGQTLGAALWFLFSAWMMAIQYLDYPFDNHKVPFSKMLEALSEQKVTSISFGALVTLFSAIPILNLVIMPVAICGASAYWVDHYRGYSTLLSSANTANSSQD